MAKKRRLKKRFVAALVLLPVLIAALGVWLYLAPAAAQLDEPVTVVVDKGLGSKAVAARLAEAGVVKNADSFVWFVRGEGAEGDLRPGTYTFNGRVDYAAVLAALKQGNLAENTQNVTIPEGKTVSQIAEIWAEAGLCTAEEFLQACADLALPYDYLPSAEDFAEPYNRLEGFLFPETYNVNMAWGAENLVKMQVAQFDKLWTEERAAQAQALGYTTQQILTVASMVEREARVADERPLIAGVIYNRLAIGQALQIDATIQYMLGEQVDRVLYEHLEIDSPYNTYLYAGLPPSPICSPGISCIDAALDPADHDYYYYRTKNDGSGEHNFAKTYAQHVAYGNS